jgi:hypothetical protein
MTKEEYTRQEDAYIKEQFKIADPKPNGMCGTWSWHLLKKREFKKIMKDKGISVE